jgi:hypothetical protein
MWQCHGERHRDANRGVCLVGRHLGVGVGEEKQGVPRAGPVRARRELTRVRRKMRFTDVSSRCSRIGSFTQCM